jgi:hypothetical protein
MEEGNLLNRDDLLDALYDLKHDLGKYIRLPVAMLGSDAGQSDLRDALKTAIYETRRGPGGVHGSREIWDEFVRECDAGLKSFATYGRLRDTCERVIGIGACLENEQQIPDKEKLLEDLGKVTVAIQDLIEEVKSA